MYAQGAMLKHTTILQLWIIACFLDVTLVSAVSTWTEWYNTDTPYDGIEEETINHVREKDENLCDGGAVKEAECRATGTSSAFKNRQTFGDNTFLIPCNATGLVCRDRDQPGNIFCNDYEIRYHCQDESSAIYDGGFIAMAAGLSVIVPLICVLIVQLKRAKSQRQRERNAQARQASQETSTSSRYHDPPPTYEELFGDDATLERYDSTTGLIPSRNNEPAHGRVSVSSMESQSDVSVSTISGELVDDSSISTSGISNPAMDSVSIENEAESRPRRFLGMHISIHDLLNYNDPVLTTPPPSYNEALEILKMFPQGSRKIAEVQT